jgi:hypothetical protein
MWPVRPGVLHTLTLAFLLVGVTLQPPPALATVAGSARVAADQSRQVSLTPPFRWLRVCNDSTSAGTVTVTIGTQASRILLPGWCTENRGGDVGIKNGHAGPALVTIRSIFPNTFQN